MEPINTALCSYGMSGHLFHAPFIDVNPNFKLYGVLERSKNIAATKYPQIKTYRSLDELLEDEHIELVIVNTPNITHYEFAKKAIGVGKHVIVEKPFTVNVDEAEELISLAKEKNVKLSVYHNRRWDSDFMTVKKIHEKGILGDIVEAEFHYDRFDPELSYKVHKETPTDGVGSLYDLGSHIIDQALNLFGMPQSVFASLDTFRKDSKVIDYFDLKLYYPSHYVTLKSSYFVLEPLPAYVLHSTNGSFVKSKADIQETELQKEKKPNSLNWGLEPDTEKGLLRTIKDGHSKDELITSEKGNYMLFYDRIFKTIRHNEPVPVSPKEALDVIKVIQAAIKSYEERKVIDL